MYNATVGALVAKVNSEEQTNRGAEPEEEEYPLRASVRRFAAADVVEQAALVKQLRKDGGAAAEILREEELLQQLRSKLAEAEKAIAEHAPKR